MHNRIYHYLSVILSLFLCFNSAFTPIIAEGEYIPEPTKETMTEVVEEEPEQETEIPEANEEEQPGEEEKSLVEKEESSESN